MRVVHCKLEEYDIYIGRPSVYGNPYQVGVSGTHSECVERHMRYLLGNAALMIRVRRELPGKVMGCWCKPKHPCHGDNYVWLCSIPDHEFKKLLARAK